MTTTRLMIAALLTLTGLATADARNKGPTLEDRRRAACYHDTQRLCGQFIPNIEKTTACMTPKKQEVSAKCRALWDVKD